MKLSQQLVDILFSECKISSQLTLKNRIVMAPMTRRRAHFDHSPMDVMVGYYSRRSDAGLIVSEGTLIDEDAIGYGNVPGIFTADHIDAWSKITEAVHKNNGRIFLQLWHCGRISHPIFHNGRLPLSASTTQANVILGSTQLSCSRSRAATKSEIDQLISNYGRATKYALEAGFDGVEIHGANGYLVDQFLHHCSNQRMDDYGGTPENMSRFVLEVVQACALEIGSQNVGIRLSPAGHMNDIINHAEDKFVFLHLLDQLNKLDIAYVHTGCFNDAVVHKTLDDKSMTSFIRANYTGTVIASGGYSLEQAAIDIHQHQFDLIAWGRLFIANPDLIIRLKHNSTLKEYNEKMLLLDLY